VLIIEFRKYDHCWLDSLVVVALSKRRGQDYNTGLALFRKAVDAVIVVFVELPEKLDSSVSISLSRRASTLSIESSIGVVGCNSTP